MRSTTLSQYFSLFNIFLFILLRKYLKIELVNYPAVQREYNHYVPAAHQRGRYVNLAFAFVSNKFVKRLKQKT